MHVTSLTVKQFRCFESRTVAFEKPFVIIGGPNGSGKTSILEALYYACYLRSFRTHTTRELIRFDESAFSLKVHLKSYGGSGATQDCAQEHAIAAGYSHDKRIIKLNNEPLTSYKELLGTYRVIALTGEDTALVKGTPDYRRRFFDQALMLQDATYLTLLKKYAGILAQRNALINQPIIGRESYRLWTEQLDAASQMIRQKRCALVAELETRVNEFLKTYFDAPFTIGLTYKPKERLFAELSTGERTFPDLSELLNRERTARYTLIGAHLDDCAVTFAGRASRHYASQGQQKLIALLLKIAQPAARQTTPACIFLLDDIMADLDDDKIGRLCALLASCNTQILFTSPLDHPLLNTIGAAHNCQLLRTDR